MSSASSAFEITRKDGRSNAQVILDLVKGAEPGRVYKYSELAEALEADADREYSIEAVRAAVVSAFNRLLKEQQRTLYNIRGEGYRLAHAAEHNHLALVRRKRADTQMARGVTLLNNVRYGEMDPDSRALHEATLRVVGALYQNQMAMEVRLRAVEDAIGLRRRGRLGRARPGGAGPG